jgi:outer membrane protein assembly factor BamB
VGQGLQADGDANKCSDMYFRAYSLIDNTQLMKFGASSKDPFAYRNWQAYDSSALIVAGSDTLIEPGENGVLYTMKLNSSYDAGTGTVKMDAEPKIVKYNYTSEHNKNADDKGRWGMENSAVGWRNYLFFTDNAGILQCVDLNTMELVYANNLVDDSDVSMVLEEDIMGQRVYLYTGCEYDELVRPLGKSGPAYARRVDAMTGVVLWTTEFEVESNSSVDGGILASPVLGREGTDLEGLIIYNVTAAVKGDSTTSYLVALDKEDGTEVWRYDMDVTGWSPSSPVPVYTEDGKGYIVQCDKAGDVALIDATGNEVAGVNVGEGTDTVHNFEATPAVYGNTIVVASRKKEIFFIEIK